MKIPKWTKITIIIGGVLVIAGVALIFILSVLPFFVGYTYIEREPERMVSHLEKTFVIDFPENIMEIRAAKTPVSWDGAVGFMVKFAADPNTVDKFLKSFQEEVKLYQYIPDRDIRGTFVVHEPRWFTEPIKRGKTASPSLVRRDWGKASSDLSVYIDTTNEENFVVYIHGGYDSELDY